MTIRLGVVMDPIQDIFFEIDTTLGILNAAQARGWEIYYFEKQNLFLKDNVPYGDARRLKVSLDKNGWYEFIAEETLALADLDAILIRLDPPFEEQYSYATFILEHAERLGVFVMNRPEALRNANEKIFITQFPQCISPTLVTQSVEHLHAFWQEHTDIICKPLNGSSASSVFRLQKHDVNANSIFTLMTHKQTAYIMAQKFIPEIVSGDKRILMLDGEPVPHVLARVPQGKDWRGSLCWGARSEPRTLTDRDRYIAEQVGPELRKRGIYLAGLDIIGDYLTEINITSPACIRPLDEATDANISGQVLDMIQKHI